MGKAFRVTKERGKPVQAPNGGTVIATVHPSSVLRAPDPDTRAQAEREFLVDIKKVARHLVYAGRAADVVTTVVDGEVLMDDRRLTRADEAAVVAECRARAARVLA